MKFHVRIKPFVSAGEVFVPGSGRGFEILPLSIFPSSDGTILRIGRSTYWFDAAGGYDGPEFKCGDGVDSQAISEALGRCKDNRGRAPLDAYFAPNTRGYDNEVALWPSKPELRGPVIVEPSRPPLLFTRCCDCGWMLPRMVKCSDPTLKLEIECPRCGKHWGAENTMPPATGSA
jgi:hypothetical protein